MSNIWKVFLLNINCRVACSFCGDLLDEFHDLSVISLCNVLPSYLAIAVLLWVTCAWEIKLFNRILFCDTTWFFGVDFVLGNMIFIIMLHFGNYLLLQLLSLLTTAYQHLIQFFIFKIKQFILIDILASCVVYFDILKLWMWQFM